MSNKYRLEVFVHVPQRGIESPTTRPVYFARRQTYDQQAHNL